MPTADTFQPLSATAAVRALSNLAARPLINSTGRFDTQAIASRVNDLWSAKQDFLAQYEGELLRSWRDITWDGIVERVWREASGAQTAWLVDKAKPVQTPAERTEYASLVEQQNGLPLYEDHKFRALTWAKQRIVAAALSRAFDATLPAQYRTRDAALADVRMPGDELAEAAE